MDYLLTQRVREEALSWVGTPWHHAARVKGVGVDCGQLLIAVFQAVGMLEKDFSPGFYPPDWMLHSANGGNEFYLKMLEDRCDRVGGVWQVGDVLTYRRGRAVAHSAVYIGQGEMVHAGLDGVLREPVRNDHRFAGAWRLRCKQS
jgi:cell wall-associated NlpC family hydrolase